MPQLQPQPQVPPQLQPQQPSQFRPQQPHVNNQFIPQQPQVNNPYIPQQPNSVAPQVQPSQVSPYQTRFTANDLPVPGRCGTQASDRIVGGEETSILDFPW